MLSLLTSCSSMGQRHLAAKELFDPATAKLLEYIRRGDESHAREALSKGLSLNVYGKEGVTPLQWLILETRNKKAVKLGMQLGADPNFKNGNGSAAINMVAGFEDSEWLRIMLDTGGNPNRQGGMMQSPLFSAVSEDRWKNITLLLERGADVNLLDKMDMSPALYAAYLNKYEIVDWLIAHGASTDVYDDTGADLALLLYESELIMPTSAPAYPWLVKVKHLLLAQGKTFPPLSPSEVRRQREAKQLPVNDS